MEFEIYPFFELATTSLNTCAKVSLEMPRVLFFSPYTPSIFFLSLSFSSAMKLNAMELPFGINHAQRKTPKFALLIIIFGTLVFLTIIPVLYPLLGYPLYLLKKSYNCKPTSTYDSQEVLQASTSTMISEGENNCDIFSGEWVTNPDAPYYTNTTCQAIQELQNCMKFGRPDSEFMKWKWKPYGCALPVFSPAQFLEIVRGKSLAFVGDSVSRNHMQSLICLLSRVRIFHLNSTNKHIFVNCNYSHLTIK